MGVPEPEAKKGAPAWMVSFGDMMTLILTFFILLVSLSKEQQIGLVAKGVGSFLVALRSFGLPGVLDASEEASIFDNVRRRFNVPPEDDPDRRPDNMLDAHDTELIKAELAKALAPHREMALPAVAMFEPQSFELTDAACRYLDMLSVTLQPGPGDVLQLEGHCEPSEGGDHRGDRWLAYARAQAVANYLIEEHGFPRKRLHARAWAAEIDEYGPITRSVDARLVMPERPD